MKFLNYFAGESRSVDGESQKLIHAPLQKGYGKASVVGVGEYK